jgi:hypothetical protein
VVLGSASPHAALAWLTSRPRYFTPSRGPKPRCLQFHPKYWAYPDSSTMLLGANHASRVRNGANFELADASCELWYRELQALVLLFTAHGTPVYLSVYATNGELVNLRREPVSEMGFRRHGIARLGSEKEDCRLVAYAMCENNYHE